MYRGRFSLNPQPPKSNGGFGGTTFDPDTGLRTSVSDSIAAPMTPSEVSAPQEPTLLTRLYTLLPRSPELQKRERLVAKELSPATIKNIMLVVKLVVAFPTDDDGNLLYAVKWNSRFIGAPPIVHEK
jgi:hypothetical protein